MQLVARTVRVTPSKQKQHNVSTVQTSSKPFIPRNPVLRSQHLKSIYPAGFNLASVRSKSSHQAAELNAELSEYEEYKGPDPTEAQLDPATLDRLRPISIEYEVGSFEECEIVVQPVQLSEHVIDLPNHITDFNSGPNQFRPNAVFETTDKQPKPASRPRQPKSVLRLPRVEESDSVTSIGLTEETSVYEEPFAEFIEITVFLSDGNHDLPQLLGSIKVDPVTPHAELHNLIAKVCAEATLTDNGAIYIKDPTTRTWKPFNQSAVQLAGGGSFEILYSHETQKEAPAGPKAHNAPVSPTSAKREAHKINATQLVLSSLLEADPTSLRYDTSPSKTRPMKAKRSPRSASHTPIYHPQPGRTLFVPFLPSPSASESPADTAHSGSVRAHGNAERAKQQQMKEKQWRLASKMQDRLRHTTSPQQADQYEDPALTTERRQASTRNYLTMLYQT